MFLVTSSMHGIAAITGNMHRSLHYFVLLERITSMYSEPMSTCIKKEKGVCYLVTREENKQPEANEVLECFG